MFMTLGLLDGDTQVLVGLKDGSCGRALTCRDGSIKDNTLSATTKLLDLLLLAQ